MTKIKFFNFTTGGGFSVAFLMIFVFLYGCLKEDPMNHYTQSDQSNSFSTQRDGEEIQVRYFVDTLLVSKDVYDAKDSTNYFHDVTTKPGSVIQTESHCFTNRTLYEYWGTTQGIPVAKSNQLDDRIRKISDSLGITSIVLGGGTPDSALAAQYNTLVTSTYNSLFPAPSVFSYTGCEWFLNYSNGNASFGHPFLPWNLALASWIGSIYPWCEDNTEAVKFTRSSTYGGYSLQVKAWRMPFYVGTWGGWPKVHTVRFGPNQTSVTLPFIGSVSKWNNKISSWLIIPPAG